MSAQFQSPAKSTSNRVSKSVRSGVSRRCAADDECDECPRKRLASRPPLLQTKLIVSQPGDRYEQEAERIAQEMASAPGSAVSGRTATRPVSRIEPLGQRVVDDAETPLDQADVNPAAESAATPTSTATKAAPETTNPPTESAAPSESQTAEGTPEGATLEAAPSAGLIIEDEAPEMAPGQMRKNAFLDELRTAVCAAADAELAAVGRSTQGCPYLARWIGYYRTKDSAHIERAIRKYAPEAVGVTSAREYIPLISERVRRGVATWATTGEITGVPEELLSQAVGGGVLGAIGGVLSGIMGAASSMLSSLGRVFFKAREGVAQQADPQEIRAQLGSGSPLDSGVKARMEGAFGYDFSRVRVHAEGQAANLSSSLSARAFTVGSDVAFGAGEYQPGTLSGDALLAHELAHVVQQGGAVGTDAPLQKGAAAYNLLEEDADVSAVGAVASLWGGTKRGLSKIVQNAMPRLRSGLSLSRCGTSVKPPQRPTGPVGKKTVEKREEEKEAGESLALPEVECSPRGVTLTELTSIPGAGARRFGWTEQDNIAQAFTPLFHTGHKTCQIGKIKEGKLTFKHFVFVKPGTYRYGSDTRQHSGCGTKDLPLHVEITSDMAEKFKQGEIEHCEDLKRAFALSVARFNEAARELEKEGTFPATSSQDCTDQIMAKLTLKMGFKDYGSYQTTRSCLFDKTKERDTKGWHDVNVNATSAIKVDPDCKKITHVLDPTHKDMLPELFKHPSKDLIKGCGE